MADEPISLLTLIPAPTGTPPYPTAFTNPSTGAMLEILDTTNTTMASTGTNSRIPPGDLLKGFLNAGSNVTITETAGVVTITGASGLPATGSNGQVLTVASGAPAWAAPVTGTSFSNVMTGGPYSTQSSTYVNVTNASLAITIPGTYMLFATIGAQVNVQTTGGVNQENDVLIQIYDNNASAAIPGSSGLKAAMQVSQVSGIGTEQGQLASYGPYIVSPTASNTYQLQFQLAGNLGTNVNAYIISCVMTAIRIA